MAPWSSCFYWKSLSFHFVGDFDTIHFKNIKKEMFFVQNLRMNNEKKIFFKWHLK